MIIIFSKFCKPLQFLTSFVLDNPVIRSYCCQNMPLEKFIIFPHNANIYTESNTLTYIYCCFFNESLYFLTGFTNDRKLNWWTIFTFNLSVTLYIYILVTTIWNQAHAYLLHVFHLKLYILPNIDNVNLWNN